MKKIQFENGTKTSEAKVTIDGVDYPVTPARYNGATPLSAYVMNKLQDNIEDTIDQKANSSNVYTKTETDTKVDSAISSIEIGGRNLIIGSANGGTDYAPGNGTLVDDGYLNNKAVSTNAAWSGYYIHMLDIANRNNLKNGDTVTISIYVSTTSENEVTHAIFLYRQNGSSSDDGGDTMILKKGVWKRYKRTFSITDVTKLVNSMRFECSAATSGYNILWSSPKIELGNKATDWTPAPEDMNTYSTNEVKIGTWINGKPLYRKVINAQFGTVVQDTETTVEVNLKNVDFVLVDKYWLDRMSSNNAINQGPIQNSITLSYTSIYSSNSTVRFRTKQSWASNSTIYAIIEYTKTTD